MLFYMVIPQSWLSNLPTLQKHESNNDDAFLSRRSLHDSQSLHQYKSYLNPCLNWDINNFNT